MCINLPAISCLKFSIKSQEYIQLSITPMDEQRVSENHVHNTIFLPYTNAPIAINSFPILMYNITWSQPPSLKAMILALTLLAYLPHTFISKLKSVGQIWPLIYL